MFPITCNTWFVTKQRISKKRIRKDNFKKRLILSWLTFTGLFLHSVGHGFPQLIFYIKMNRLSRTSVENFQLIQILFLQIINQPDRHVCKSRRELKTVGWSTFNKNRFMSMKRIISWNNKVISDFFAQTDHKSDFVTIKLTHATDYVITFKTEG